MIGDRLLTDIVGANYAGWLSVLVCRKSSPTISQHGISLSTLIKL